MAILEVKNIYKSFGRNHVLRGIDFDLEMGEVLSIIGSSGSGKTTLLRCLNSLEFADEGQIIVNGEPIFDASINKRPSESELRQKRLHFGLVFQNFNLFPQYSVLENVTLAPKLLNKGSKEEIEQYALELIESVGLRDKVNSYPCELSGGQQQRVAIARALAVNTPILLMDEPFGALDTKTRASLQDLLLSLWRSEEKKKTVIFVTHDVDEAIFLSDRIVIMQPNPGRIYKEVSVPFSRPRIRENITDTEEYKIFRNEIINVFYEAEKEVAYHDTEKKISAGNSSVVRSFNSGSVSAVAGGR